MGSKGDKSNFSQICRLWRQYLKEKGSLSGLGIDMAPVPAGGRSRITTTISLSLGADLPGEEQIENKGSPISMDLFPQHSGFEESGKILDAKQMEKGQLTIFYAGKVMVFDDFPAAKAKDLMQMASNESIAAQKISFSAPRAAASPSKLDSMLAAASGSQSMAAPSPDSPSKTSASDMPIARRNSLHRFLEKRKDRINTKAPYQVNGASPSTNEAEAKVESSQAWLNLGRQVSPPEHSSESSK
ncbi:hypothetical protein OPV22_026619 [Ensete ventricosum]|uniref:Protein TIFY n=1 Tax=Ensete ventricosum TaxID=4639 RepID=A0AAV8P8N2_ENSVE|nr:hypothetical protein OPV22_026619 [Ensete ventricosum]